MIFLPVFYLKKKKREGLDQKTSIKCKHLPAELSIHACMYYKYAHSKIEGKILMCKLCIKAPARKNSFPFQGNQIGLDLRPVQEWLGFITYLCFDGKCKHSVENVVLNGKSGHTFR